MELTITKEKVLEAASKCETAKATLQVLFPEVFKPQNIVIPDFELKDNGGFLNLMQKSRQFSDRIWLSDRYEWIIKKEDVIGELYLIPTKI